MPLFGAASAQQLLLTYAGFFSFSSSFSSIDPWILIHHPSIQRLAIFLFCRFVVSLFFLCGIPVILLFDPRVAPEPNTLSAPTAFQKQASKQQHPILSLGFPFSFFSFLPFWSGVSLCRV